MMIIMIMMIFMNIMMTFMMISFLVRDSYHRKKKLFLCMCKMYLISAAGYKILVYTF